ncbi:bifunctional glycosyltransferase/CDP-glycerol:glycerophosphate glycerophosphotransferase [Cellulosimicrobium arenosum]|uniref:Glycosyltransferase n=1 Tax=Cellulosimicrobium arenosum TaxID=2708133 RepID=A0A927PF67_9MICO|nr:glycosyltransferase [Cellulosimicrobium arenosum]MBD8080178.1 glycosyltransferase [Cellulosimicrobium arenosum]
MTDVDTTSVNLSQSVWDELSPHTSLVIACYRVGAYLPAFLKSLDEQTAAHDGYELIFVVDGCPEDSEDVVRAWMPTTDYAVRIVTKPNGGVASARNTGLAWARGAWVSHPDPDDRLDPQYFLEVERAREQFPDETMFAARAVLTSPDGSTIGHTLDARYVDAVNSLVDLHREPRKIHTLGGVVFFRHDVIKHNRLRFDPRILQSSDTDMIGHFLLCNGARYVLVPHAEYYYLRRADASSIVSKHSGNMSRYASLFGVSHHGMLDRAGEECPPWLANLLLYFVFMLFRRNRRVNTPVDLASEDQLALIRARLVENLRQIGAANIQGFDLFAVPLEIRFAWLSAVEDVSRSPVELVRWHPERSAWRAVVYGSNFAFPELRVVEGTAEILESRCRGIEFLGTTWLYQQVLLVRMSRGDSVRVESTKQGFALEFDGALLKSSALDERAGRLPAIDVKPAARAVAQTPDRSPMQELPGTGLVPRLRRLVRRITASEARPAPSPESVPQAVQAVHSETWVFVTGDDAEAAPSQSELLYELVRAEARDVEARFVVDEGSEAERRLRQANIEWIAAGSPEHVSLMSRADLLVTSRMARLAHVPLPGSGIPRRWRVALLPSGEISRISHRDRWTSQADLVVVSSAVELFRAGGPYGYQTYLPSEVALTGLPAHDRLEELRAPAQDILVAPGWRAGTLRPSDPGSAGRSVEEFHELPFVGAWREFLGSAELSAVAARGGRRVRLLLPPGVGAEVFGLPSQVDLVPPEERLTALASAAILVTDYTTHDLDLAYLGRPSVYLQVDREVVLGAPDSARSRAAAYETSGFGPAVTSVEAALGAVAPILEHLPAMYAERIERAFTYRDGKARSRILAALRG